MPQMMPLNWSLLMIYFILIFILINIFLYFNFNYQNKKIKKTYKTSLKWMW
uniref:ATP synthase complex subunit 8 n=1 Tax=Rodolia quadrimaculata TaxID=2678939 RepID=A0A6B9ML16_9CUCU|nr:ATP synthase F0 subunit 8 [Rodolia quadrimaculata]